MNLFYGIGNFVQKGMELANDGLKVVANKTVGGLVHSLFTQDDQRIKENKEAIGSTLHEMVYDQVENIYGKQILPNLGNGYYGGGVQEYKYEIINTITSVIETVLRRLATNSSKLEITNSKESKELPISENTNVTIVSTENSPQQVTMDPSQYTASIFSELLRVIKNIAAKEEYKALLEGTSKEELEEKFFKEVVESILLEIFPDKGADKALPAGARWLLTILTPFGLGWDGIIKKIATQMKVLVPHYKEILKSDGPKDSKGVDEVVDPIISIVQQGGNEKGLLIPINGMKPEHNQVIDGAVKHILAGDVLGKDQQIIGETWGFLSSMMKKIVGHFLVSAATKEASMDKALIKHVGAETFINTIIQSIARTLHNKTDNNKPLIEGNPAADSLIKNLLKKKNKKEDSTTSSFVKTLLGMVINRAVANLFCGSKEEPMDNLKDKLEKVFSKIENLAQSFTTDSLEFDLEDNNVKRVLASRYDEEITFQQRLQDVKMGSNNEEEFEFYRTLMIRVSTLELLDEIISDDEIKELLPPVFHCLDVKELVFPMLVVMIEDLYKTTQQIEGQYRRDEKFLQGNGMKNKESLQGVIAAKDFVEKIVIDVVEGYEKAAQKDDFILLKDDKFLNKLAQYFFNESSASKTRGYVKGLVPKIITQVFDHLMSGKNKNPLDNLKGRLNGIILTLQDLHDSLNTNGLDSLELIKGIFSIQEENPNMNRVLSSQYDEHTTFAQRFEEIKKGNKASDYKEFYKRLVVNLYSLEILEEVLSDKEMKKLVPDIIDVKSFIFPTISAYLLDVMDNINGLDPHEQSDIQVMDKYKMVGDIKDHYVDMGMNIITDMIKKGVMASGEKAHPLATLINWVAQTLVTDPSVKDNQDFIQNHLNKVVNRVMVYLLNSAQGINPEEKMANLMNKIIHATTAFSLDVEKILSGNLDFVEFKNAFQICKNEKGGSELFKLTFPKMLEGREKLKELLQKEENKKLFGEIDVENMKGEELVELWGALLIAEQADSFIKKLVPDELLKQILPNFAFELVRPELVQQIARATAQNSTYLVDVVNHYNGLKDNKANDEIAINAQKGLGKIRDHYIAMGMKKVDDLKNGVMTPKGEKDPLAALVNWLAKIGVTSPAMKNNKDFVENHLKTIVNRALVYLLGNVEGKNPQEKISGLISKIVEKSASLTKNIKETDFKEVEEFSEWMQFAQLEKLTEKQKLQTSDKMGVAKSTVKELLETNKELFGEIDVDQLNEAELIELWSSLLIAKHVDAFLKEIVPDELLKQIIPEFSIKMVRPLLMRTLAGTALMQAGPWIVKGSYGSVMDVLKMGLVNEGAQKFFGKGFNIDNTKSLREALNKTAVRGLKMGIRLGFTSIFGDRLGVGLQWLLFIVLFPVAILAQWLILKAVDHMYMKKIDAYIKTNDFDQLMTKIVGKVPALLNAIHSEENDPKIKQQMIKKAARDIVDELKDIFTTGFMKNILANQIIAQLIQKEEVKKAVDKNAPKVVPEEGFFNWLAPMLIEEVKVAEVK